MEKNESSPLEVAIIDAFGAAEALKGNLPTTEHGRHARRYVLPAHQFQRLIWAAVQYGTPPASVKLALSASLHTQSGASSSPWTAAEATLHMRNIAALHGFEVEIITVPEGSFGRLMELREYSGRVNLPYDEGELIFHAIDLRAPLITCSKARSQAFRSRIYLHELEAYELEHTCPDPFIHKEKR